MVSKVLTLSAHACHLRFGHGRQRKRSRGGGGGGGGPAASGAAQGQIAADQWAAMADLASAARTAIERGVPSA